eukprot:CAMPEP_0168316792 /NCGR_PEP_ID=MMETSP0210-20121227/19228_1 /TAXON_ID=40633 /ORGANISM="Condylostoma magnum, Strain COL2" /LENGTH=54 /DNA_ID=CAMNT_0008304569 /DNA_START=272 /DNA_END=436 /DNA_ORIENTATION=-
MRVNGLTAKPMAEEYYTTQMAQSARDSGQMGNWITWEDILLQVAITTKECGKRG